MSAVAVWIFAQEAQLAQIVAILFLEATEETHEKDKSADHPAAVGSAAGGLQQQGSPKT
jgi:hypothetical protein